MPKTFSKFKKKLPLLFCFIFVVLIFIREAPHFLVKCPIGDVCEVVGREIEIEGEIISLNSERLERTLLEIEVQAPLKGKILVTLSHTQYDFDYGDRVLLKGKLKLPERNEGENFSYPLYLAGRGIFSIMVYPKITRLDNNSVVQNTVLSKIYGPILALREKVRQKINLTLVEPYSSIMNSMIVGDQGSVPKDLRKKLSEVGIIHILSVSGAHITLLIAIIVFLAGKFSSNRIYTFILVVFGVALYLLLAGSPKCASRSAIMGMLAFAAITKGRNPNLKLAMWLSASLLLFISPSAILSDIGFQLSFLAILGMVYVYPMLDKCFTWGRLGFGWSLLRVILLSISISVTTNPLVFYYFGIISWVSPIANLVLMPLFSLLLPIGFILVGVGFSPFLSEIIALTLYFQIAFIVYLVELILKIPGSYTEAVTKPGWIILYYVFLLIAVLILNPIVSKLIFPRRLNYFVSERYLGDDTLEFKPKEIQGFSKHNFAKLRKKCSKVTKKLKNQYENEFNNRASRIIFWSIQSFVGFSLLISVSYLHFSNRNPGLFSLNVGQGDALLFNWPKYHFQILVDGGPGRNVLAELGESLPFYDRKIEILMLSHSHQDHIEGLINVLERYNVSLAVSNSLPSKYESRDLYSLSEIFWRKLLEKRISISIGRENQQLFLSLEKQKIAEFRFLAPLFDLSNYHLRDLNNASAVVKMEYPKKVLLAGDATSELERIILKKEVEGSHNLQSEILKVGHHGSRFSTSDEFLNAVQPKTALICVSENNTYGHPAKNIIEKLENIEARIYRTDSDGRVEIGL